MQVLGFVLLPVTGNEIDRSSCGGSDVDGCRWYKPESLLRVHIYHPLGIVHSQSTTTSSPSKTLMSQNPPNIHLVLDWESQSSTSCTALCLLWLQGDRIPKAPVADVGSKHSPCRIASSNAHATAPWGSSLEAWQTSRKAGR